VPASHELCVCASSISCSSIPQSVPSSDHLLRYLAARLPEGSPDNGIEEPHMLLAPRCVWSSKHRFMHGGQQKCWHHMQSNAPRSYCISIPLLDCLSAPVHESCQDSVPKYDTRTTRSVREFFLLATEFCTGILHRNTRILLLLGLGQGFRVEGHRVWKFLDVRFRFSCSGFKVRV